MHCPEESCPRFLALAAAEQHCKSAPSAAFLGLRTCAPASQNLQGSQPILTLLLILSTKTSLKPFVDRMSKRVKIGCDALKVLRRQSTCQTCATLPHTRSRCADNLCIQHDRPRHHHHGMFDYQLLLPALASMNLGICLTEQRTCHTLQNISCVSCTDI